MRATEERATFDPLKQWLLFAVTEPALLHGILAHAATDLCARKGVPVMAESYFHRAKAIELINRRLNEEELETDVVSDGLLAAVGCLAYQEVRFLLLRCVMWCAERMAADGM